MNLRGITRLPFRCGVIFSILFFYRTVSGNELVDHIPKNPITYNGERLSVKVPVNSSSCTLLGNFENSNYNITAGDECVITFDNIGINLNDKQFRVTITTDVELSTNNITLKVIDRATIKNFTASINFGDKFDMNASQPNALQCQFISPDSKIVSEFTSSCIYTLNPAVSGDHGSWKVNTIFQGITEIVTSDYEIIIKETYIGDWKIEGNKIHLSCNVGHPVNYCGFYSPDNKLYSMAEGGGNSKYYYYGNGFESGSCGMTIENPTKVDNNIWQCIWGEDSYRYLHVDIAKNSGSYSDYVSNEKNIASHGPKDIYGTKGEKSSVIKFSIEAMLSYCYFTSPDGSTYFPPTDNATQLNSGICTFQTEFVEELRGEWTCYFGIREKINEEKLTFNLHVEDNMIKANPTSIIKDNKATISCEMADNRPLRYCRYITPIGTRIHVDNNLPATPGSDKYKSLKQEHVGQCSIEIKNVVAQDKGEWKCIGKEYAAAGGAEYRASVTVIDPNAGLSGGAVAGIIIAILIIVAAIGVAGWYRYGHVIRHRFFIPRN